MQRILPKILRKLIKGLTVALSKTEKKIESDISQLKSYRIAGKYEGGIKVHQVKPETIERITPLKIYQLIVGGEIRFKSEEQFLMKYIDSVVYPHSDFIITQGLAVWDKFYSPVFTKNLFQDKDIALVKQNVLYLKNKEKKILFFHRAFSLCGVHADVWSHFMIQYLPKLYYLNNIHAFFDEKLTVLVPNQTDKHLVEVLHAFLKDKQQVEIHMLQDDEVASCSELYSMESATQMIDHESYVSYADMIIPQQVAMVIKENLVKPFLADYLTGNEKEGLKLFIRRKNAGYRNMINVDEVEQFFEKEGFLFIEPHLLSFQEKVTLFSQAEVVVGPYSSGFSNLIFSKQKTKVLMFSNLQRSFEPYLSFFDQHFQLNFLTVTGADENAADSHSSFYIPLEKVKAAYNQMIKQL
jgi:capsular polysaccharide biosynthesis protein